MTNKAYLNPSTEWRLLEEFPEYEISNWGVIINLRTQRTMKVSSTNHGHLKVALVNDRGRFTRSVAVLVAQTFVPAPDLLCDSVILLNGDLDGVAACNLAWRPPHFAWKYTRQLKQPQPAHYINLSVRNTTTEEVYQNVIDAGIREGLLFDDIWRSTYTGVPVYPSQYSFEIEERV